AYSLISKGRHVLIVDLDLEAPGISGFLARNEELEKSTLANPKDVLSLLELGIDAVRNGKPADDLPPVSNFLRPVRADKVASLEPKFGKVGRLDVIGADQERDYLGRLATLPIKELSNEQLITLSRLLHRYFKSQRFAFRPLGFEETDPPISTPYDYVLIDSRTGITEIGGLCVGPLADRLVVITSLNDQNVTGTRTFLREAGIELKTRTADAEPWDEADTSPSNPEAAASLGPKPTIVVASPVPPGEVEAKRNRMKELETALGIRPLSLPYHPQMALMESIFVRDYRDEYLAAEYAKVTESVLAQVEKGPQILKDLTAFAWTSETVDWTLRLASSNPDIGVAALQLLTRRVDPSASALDIRRVFTVLARDPGSRPFALAQWARVLDDQAKAKGESEADKLFTEAERKYAEALRLKPDFPEALNNWGNALHNHGKAKSGAEADQLFTEAVRKYEEAIRLKTDFAEVLSNWASVIGDQAKAKSGSEADELFTEAERKYAEALRLKPSLAGALSNWGIALGGWAKRRSGAESDQLFTEARQKYAEALRLQPDFPDALRNWAATLLDLANTKSGGEGEQLLEEAALRCREALRLNPAFAEAFSNWGVAFHGLAKIKSGAEADQLFIEAGQKQLEALRLKPNSAQPLLRWGNALGEWAQTKRGAEADQLFAEAGQKYAEALRIKPALADAHNYWAADLIYQANTKTGAQADILYDQARVHALQAESISPGVGRFNLACIEGRLGNSDAAVAHLRSWQSVMRVTQKIVRDESDFDLIRTDPEFAAFVQTLPDE
ncbi:MAG TPA: hypothetical protein VGL53_30405, partial [Bryobacteraceae bacterium]